MNFFFVRLGVVVVEVFLYFYYIDVFWNFMYVVGIDVYLLLGVRVVESMWMWVFLLLGWDVCFSMMWCKNYVCW